MTPLSSGRPEVATLPAVLLTPGEVVFLNGEKFTARTGWVGWIVGYPLLNADGKVLATDFAVQVYAAAFIASRGAQTISLETREGKGLFGLGVERALYAVPCSTASDWPAGSLEDRILCLAKELEPNNRISNLVSSFLGQDCADPYRAALDLIKTGLAQRGLLECHKARRFCVFTVRHYRLPQRTGVVAAEQVDAVRKMLDNFQRVHVDVRKLLTREIRRGIDNRKHVEPSEAGCG
jgi:hypothetical protein